MVARPLPLICEKRDYTVKAALDFAAVQKCKRPREISGAVRENR